MLPPTVTLNPAASSIRPVSAVVVDLPFVPVIAITRPCSQRDASSISPMTGTPARARGVHRRLIGRHARAEHDEVGAGEGLAPVPAELERDAQRAQQLGSGTSRRESDSVTRAPRRASSRRGRDAALAPRPATVTRLSCHVEIASVTAASAS